MARPLLPCPRMRIGALIRPGSIVATLAAVALASAACSGKKTAPPAPPSTLGVDWVAEPGNPLTVDGVCPGWRCAASGDPAIARAPDGSLVLWFTTLGIETDGMGGFVSQLNIGRATSADVSPLAFQVSPDQPVISS